MKFIADAMLGRLAKQLRLLGFDVLYDHRIDDQDIIRLSLEQHRVILTRDTTLAKRPLAANHCFIKSNRVRDQIAQVLSAYGSPAASLPLSRCSLCNELLVPVTKQDIQDRVPRFVYEQSDGFLQCPHCEKIYWRGTHTRNMAEEGT